MILKPQEMDLKDVYKVTSGTVLPRPIAWVSTQGQDGTPNLAPFSFFTVASTRPLTLLFCPSFKPNGEKKDSWRNAEETGAFVVNLTNEATAEAMNRSAALLEYGVSEFSFAGLTPAPGVAVAAPRVQEAPVSFECTLAQILELGTYAVVLGEVQCIHIDEAIYDGNYVDLQAMQPIGRLSGSGYCRVTDLFEMERPLVPETAE